MIPRASSRTLGPARPAENHWRRLDGSAMIVRVIEGKAIKDGILVYADAI